MWWEYRKMKTCSLVVVLALCITTTGASAEFLTGNKLWELCKGSLTEDIVGDVADLTKKYVGVELTAQQYTTCASYTLGVLDSVEATITRGLMTPIFCMPQDSQVTPVQVEDIVKKFLEEHPEDRHRDGADNVYEAMINSFPCEEVP